MRHIEAELHRVCDAHVASDKADARADEPRTLRPLERLRIFADEGSLQIIRSQVRSECIGERAQCGDGVIGGAGRVAGRSVFCFAQDFGYLGGSLGEQHAETILRVLRLARKARAPVIGFIESGGARMQEGLAALDGYARIFSEHIALSGQVPQISVITGAAAGGGSYAPALTDFVVTTAGPVVVRDVTGEDVSARELGGARVHGRNGVCQFAVPTDADAILLVRRLLGYLPASCWEDAPLAVAAEPAGPAPGDVVPLDGRRVYDIRDALAGIVDADSLLESSSEWAPNLVTAFARINGMSIGVVANQPRHLGGVIDADASQKGARFVRTCDAYGLPLAVFVDTPGFLPGSRQEAVGVIRYGAELLRAFGDATVPRFTVVLRKAFGGAYITMNSKDLGADLYLAWNRAQLGIMGAEQAAGVVHRRALAAADDQETMRARLAREYAAEHLTADAAARVGAVDEVIRPTETPVRLAWALATSPASAPTVAGDERD